MKMQMTVIAAMLAATLAPVTAQQTAAPATAPRARTATSDAPPPPPPPPPVGSDATKTPRRVGQPVNIQMEFTITDQRDGVPAIKRTVTVIAGDTYTGQIRSQSEVMAAVPRGVPFPVVLNIDASPELLADGKIRAGVNLQYDWILPQSEGTPAVGTVIKTSLRDTLSLILESGKTMIAAQSADPSGDRKVTVEVKATVLK